MTTPDLSEFLARSKPPHRSCGLAKAAARLSENERILLDAALAEPVDVITTAGIIAWFASRDIRVSDQMVRRHRRGVCSCD